MTPAPATLRTPEPALIERARFIACGMLIVFLGGWGAWFAPFDDLLDGSGTPLGADFSMFYVAGRMVYEGRGEQLYDPAQQQAMLRSLFPKLDPQFALPYRYPPFVAVVLATLACLPYAAAFAVFFGLSWAFWMGALWILTSNGPDASGLARGTVLLIACGWPVALETLIGGQASMFALLVLALTITLLQRNRDGWAGAVMALAAYKPNVLLLVGIGLVLARPRMLRGMVPVALLLGALSFLPAGGRGLVEYAELSSRLATARWDLETPHWKVHGIVPWLNAISGGHGRTMGFVLGVVATVAIACRLRIIERASTPPPCALPLAAAFLITLNALLNPYTPIYDLVLLAAGFLISIRLHGRALDNLRSPTTLPATSSNSFALSAGFSRLSRASVLPYGALAAFYFGPHISQAVAQVTGWQWSAILLVALAGWQARRFAALPVLPAATGAVQRGPAVAEPDPC